MTQVHADRSGPGDRAVLGRGAANVGERPGPGDDRQHSDGQRVGDREQRRAALTSRPGVRASGPSRTPGRAVPGQVRPRTVTAVPGRRAAPVNAESFTPGCLLNAHPGGHRAAATRGRYALAGPGETPANTEIRFERPFFTRCPELGVLEGRGTRLLRELRCACGGPDLYLGRFPPGPGRARPPRGCRGAGAGLCSRPAPGAVCSRGSAGDASTGMGRRGNVRGRARRPWVGHGSAGSRPARSPGPRRDCPLPKHRPWHLGAATGFLPCCFPWLSFRTQVRHQIQRYLLSSLPAARAVQQGTSWRTAGSNPTPGLTGDWSVWLRGCRPGRRRRAPGGSACRCSPGSAAGTAEGRSRCRG